MRNQHGAIPLLILAAGIGLLLFLTLISFAPFRDSILSTLFPKQSSYAASTTDWPMYQGNPQHTGSTTATFTPVMGTTDCQRQISGISPCIQPRWKASSNEWSHGQSQPVVVGNTVYWAVMDGKLRAVDTETGAERWMFDAGSAIAVTPAVVEGKIFFGDFSGKIYGLNVVDKSAVFAPIQTDGPIYSSPVVVREGNTLKVFIGSNDGKMYGINGETGAQLFSPFITDSYVVSNPAYFNGKVFFSAENMNAYAISSSTGQEVWKKKLTGESNRFNNPVVVSSSNTVLFHSVPRYVGTGTGLKDRYGTYFIRDKAATSLTDALNTYQAAVLAAPDTKSMYLFNTDSGTEITGFSVNGQNLQMIPLNTWYMNTQNQPLVEDNKNLIFLALGGIIRLDTLTNQFSMITNYMPVRGDEYTAMTLADGWLYGGFLSQIAKQQIQGQTNVLGVTSPTRVRLRGCPDCADDNTPSKRYYLLDDPLVPLNHWRSYTGDGATNIGGFFIVAGNHAFWSEGGWLYGF